MRKPPENGPMGPGKHFNNITVTLGWAKGVRRFHRESHQANFNGRFPTAAPARGPHGGDRRENRCGFSFPEACVSDITFDLGDAALTRRVKKLAEQRGAAVVKAFGPFNGWGRPVVGYTVDNVVYQEAVWQLRVERTKQAAGVSVLQALFTLNRRAKRCLELAQKYYWQRLHGFATEQRHEKERIYRMKGQALRPERRRPGVCRTRVDHAGLRHRPARQAPERAAEADPDDGAVRAVPGKECRSPQGELT
jgi:hypothetical protein